MWPVAWELQKLQGKLRCSGLLGTACTAEDNAPWTPQVTRIAGACHGECPWRKDSRSQLLMKQTFPKNVSWILGSVGKSEEFDMFWWNI